MTNSPATFTHGQVYGVLSKMLMLIATCAIAAVGWYLSNINNSISDLTAGLKKNNEINNELIFKYNALDKDVTNVAFSFKEFASTINTRFVDIEKTLQVERSKIQAHEYVLEKHGEMIADKRRCIRDNEACTITVPVVPPR